MRIAKFYGIREQVRPQMAPPSEAALKLETGIEPTA
jgi:hypothetical protein